CPHRRLHLLDHARDGIAIAVKQAADQEAGNLDVFQRPHRAAPELAVAPGLRRPDGTSSDI
ncbi:hypothetical protein HYR69_08980, partial [Candidatus Sumerlaeota bacterium]|nr:hypothetical protein [Candidatus Sumerlaeota bacterium]